MKHNAKLKVFLALVFCLGMLTIGHCADCAPVSQCVPDRPVPPETIGSLSVPFDLPDLAYHHKNRISHSSVGKPEQVFCLFAWELSGYRI